LKRFLVDSGYVLALYKDEGDRTLRARRTFEEIISTSGNVLVIPWPVLYERFNSEFSRRRDWIGRLNSDWSRLQKSRKLEYVDDSPFREICKRELLGLSPERSGRFAGLSLVDRILMALIEDRTKKIEALLTFDLRDFTGFCTKRQIEILPGA